MIEYENLPRITELINYQSEYRPVIQWRPVIIDENYFDKMARFGFACIIAAIVGKLVMSSLSR